MDGLGYEWIRLMHQLILVDVEHIAGKEKPGPKKKKKKMKCSDFNSSFGM